MRDEKMPATGGCQCGRVTYQLLSEPLNAYCCHCTECRKQSASAFGISVILKTDDFKLMSGEPKCWSRTTSNGAELKCYFCDTCGTRIWHWADDDPDHVSVKGGTLDTPLDWSKLDHIWTSSMLAGIVIPDHTKSWPQEPDLRCLEDGPRTHNQQPVGTKADTKQNDPFCNGFLNSMISVG